MRNTVAVVVAFAVTVTGCLTDPEDVELGSVGQEAAGCPTWVCGENSPTIDVFEFHELDESGLLPNAQQMRITRMFKGSNVYAVNVVGARLFGQARGLPTLAGLGLKGARIEVDTPQGLYHLHIINVGFNTHYWTGNPDVVESYEIGWTKVGGATAPRNICPRPPPSRRDPQGGLYGSQVEAFVFTGDRYDANKRTVIATDPLGAGRFFNFSCPGSATAKMLLTRHTWASMDSTHPTGLWERQSLLKMYTSDVCPAAGVAFTVAGTKLHYEDPAKYWFALDGGEASMEGFWGPDGAICLEHHRLSPMFDVEIAAACPGVPKCSTLMPGWPASGAWPAGAYLLSANPP